ncbi:MAG: dihydroxy-acid dehydratase [Synergistaceae bacterium]|nr:dihydroxy-acid dehydratase [Synergistaceae bacterium]MDY0283531.1 dihydroxy-acid dehydratase [Synergistaceae bacterium]
MKFRSSEILSDPVFTENRALYKSMGFSDEDLKGPLIGIANSWNELVPGHYNLRNLSEFVKKGIYRAGGMAVEFGVIAACDGQSCGHNGMKYILPTRDLIACDIEAMVEAHRLDGIVMLGSCDKIVPGMLMAAARLGIPAILLVGGPMAGGVSFDGRKSDSTSVSEAVGMLSAGRITKETLSMLEDNAAPSCGSCSYYGTANSMGCAAEAMGMSLTGSSLIPATASERFRAGEMTGIKIVELVKRGVTARDIITRNSLENAAKIMVATGGSTNTFIHLSAIAHEIGTDAETMMEIYDRASETIPSIAMVNPASCYDMEDFYRAGGIPQVMKELGEEIDLSCMTVTGENLGDNLKAWTDPFGVDRRVIRTKEDPFCKSGGLAVMRGNLAPGTGITKPIAMDPAMYHFSGPARVFDCEEDANLAILNGKIKDGDVLVIRYEGPKGGPGMREMYFAMKLLYGRGLAKKTAIITDGRFSGTNNGCFVGHISPEAAEGGPIAAVRDGDIITIDVENKRLDVDLSPEELEARLKDWKRPPQKELKGILAIYAKLAASAAEGGMMKV